MSDIAENKKGFKNKKIFLIVIIIILITLFIGYGISFKSTPESREKKIISYLEKKYNSKFEIIKLKDSGENVIMEEINCDGSTFWPKITDKDVYYYTYEVHSVSDDVTFEVKYIDKRLKDEIIEVTTYYSLTNKNDVKNDIDDYIINILGNNNIIKTESNGFKISQNFDEICDSNYVKKLEKISDYVKEKNSIDKDLDILVYFEYDDDILVVFGYSKPIITKRSTEYFDGAAGVDIVSGKYIKTYRSIEEYLER